MSSSDDDVTIRRRQFVDDRAMREDDDDESEGEGDSTELGVDLEDSEEEPDGIDDMTEEDKMFIADDDDGGDDDDQEGDDGASSQGSGSHRRNRKKLRKRRKRERQAILSDDDDGELDEDDLDLVEENTGLKVKEKKSFKRLKRRRDREQEEDDSLGVRDSRRRDVTGIFDDEDMDMDYDDAPGGRRQGAELGYGDDNFIVDDDENDPTVSYSRAQARDRRQQMQAVQSSYDRSAGYEDHGVHYPDEMYELFGNGDDYAWVLEKQDEAAERAKAARSGASASAGRPNAYGEYDDDYGTGEPSIKLTDVFEPSEVQAKMLTDLDEIIRSEDFPERMQLANQTTPIDPVELRSAQRWITDVIRRRRDRIAIQAAQRGGAMPHMFPENLLADAVLSVLKFMREEFFEIPFIIVHRRDHWHAALSEEEVWSIADEEAKHSVIYAQSRALIAKAERARIYEQDHVEWLMQAGSLAEIKDVADYLDFTFAKSMAELQRAEKQKSGGYRAPSAKHKRMNDAFEQEHVEVLTREFTVPPRELMDNLQSIYRLTNPGTPSMSVEAAMVSIAPKGVAWDRFKSGYVKYLAQRLFHYPPLRKVLRDAFLRDGYLSTSPTDIGLEEIQPGHPCFAFKYISRKPVRQLFETPEQFLSLAEAEEQGKIKITLAIDERNDFKAKLLQGWTDRGDEWGELRFEIITMAYDLLYQQTIKAMRDAIVLDAQQAVATQCGQALFKLAHIAPYKVRGSGSKNPTKTADYPRTLALTVFPRMREYLVMAALMDESGRCTDHFAESFQLEGLPAHLQRLSPDVVVVDVSPSLASYRLVDQVKLLVSSQGIPVETLVDTVAQAYMESTVAKTEFPEFAPQLRKCVGLGRQLQDAQHVIASLFPDDVFKVQLHPKQALVPEEGLRNQLVTAMLRSVMTTGADINAARLHPHLSHTLQFVAGLGPRKVVGILPRVQKLRAVTSREMLVYKDLMAGRVFFNSAAFIHIDEKYVDDRELEPLDLTRIHPEDYALARKMARDAMDMYEGDEQDNPSAAISELWRTRREYLLADLDLREYAEVIKQRTEQQKHQELELIRAELTDPFAEHRASFHPMTNEAIVSAVLGDKLVVGAMVSAKVVVVLDKLVRLRLDNGIECIMWPRNVSQERDFATVVKEGQVVQAAILEIDTQRLCLSLTMIPQELDTAMANPKFRDPHFSDAEWQDERRKREERERARALYSGNSNAGVVAPTAVKHTLFRPFNKAQAEAYLRERARVGDAVIRPSSRPDTPLVLSWLVVGDIVQHVDIKIDPQTKKYSLNTSWQVRNAVPSSTSGSMLVNSFHDLDEILFRYVEACAKQIDKVASHRKFVRGPKQHLVDRLQRDIAATPNVIAYGIAAHPDFPGHFFLSWCQATGTIHDAFFKVVPQGYIFNDREYQNVEQLVTAFKNGFTAQQAGTAGLGHAPTPGHVPPPAFGGNAGGYAGGYSGGYNGGYNGGYSGGYGVQTRR